MFLKFLFGCLLTILIVPKINTEDISNQKENQSEWDVLIFTQQWPVTTCIHWMEENENNKCDLPTQEEFWTIHGIWPTKYETTGPSYCNQSAEFDITKIYAIEDKLKLFWPNIEEGMGTDSLWRHEWDKHGTCAASDENLSDEFKYFNQGLKWRNSFNMSEILGNAGIHPDSNNTVINILNALKRTLNKNPSIHCVYDRHKDLSLLSEIRICFDKALNLIDCDQITGSHIAIDYPGGKLITNCHISKPVVYPSRLPSKANNKTKYKFNFLEAFKLLNFIMWLTL
ncbi:ribonuclease Oy [Condylostylus longicornis]|uniref:ribonuclease Oy n=1 Tax=Condylostylus longicornis TaxID=2530218 RepID=UPI00244DCB7F|nr:ribonuclease Oy [Condylostylus longicornis]